MRKRTSKDSIAVEAVRRTRDPGSEADTRWEADTQWTVNAAHRLEHAVQRRLLSHPELQFSSLVIRRIPKGVCLEGVLEGHGSLDVCSVARSVAGVDEVLNHLVVRCPIAQG
jgi:hypothetical protein